MAPDGTVTRPSGKVVVWSDNGTGYQRTSVREPGSRKTYTVTHHRVVMETLVPNPNGYEDINHLDGDKTNCHPSNLEWVSRGMNMRHAWATGLVVSTPKHKASSAARLRQIAKTYPRDKGGRCASIDR